MFKVLGAVVYFIIYKYFFLDYIFQRYPNIYSFDQGFEDKYYNDINIIGITEVLMNIVSYHGFSKDNTPTAILTRQRNLVP